MKTGRAGAGAARFFQQPQFRQVQGLQRQPPDLQRQAQTGLAFSILVIVFLL